MRQNHFLQLVANPACIMANVYIAIAFAFLSFVAIWLHAGFISFVALIIVVGLATVMAVFGMLIQVTMLVLSAGREKDESRLELWELKERARSDIYLNEQTQMKMLGMQTSLTQSSLPPSKNIPKQIASPASQADDDTDDDDNSDDDDRVPTTKTVNADKQADIDKAKVLTYFRQYPNASYREAEDAVGFKKDKIAKHLRQLRNEREL